MAAIVNHRYNDQLQRPAVRFGWLDLVNDAEVLRALLKAVEDYGREKGMKEIIGSLGFTDMDPEGMLTKGFDQLGTLATPVYLAGYIERLGTGTATSIFSISLKINKRNFLSKR